MTRLAVLAQAAARTLNLAAHAALIAAIATLGVAWCVGVAMGANAALRERAHRRADIDWARNTDLPADLTLRLQRVVADEQLRQNRRSWS